METGALVGPAGCSETFTPATAAFDPDEDRLHEECGVFGVFGHPDAAAITALGLHALQHRGQEAAGIVSFDGRRFSSERRMGLVSEHFSSAETIKRLPGAAAIGHVRYATQGETILRNVQPLFAELDSGGFAVAHNGNLTNAVTLRRELIREGTIYQSTSDTEVILHLVARSRKPRLLDRFIEALRQIEGAYSLVALTNKKLIGARDPLGIRPLVLGEIGGHYILASETCALDIIGARFVRDIENGEIVSFPKRASKATSPSRRSRCGPASSNTSISRGRTPSFTGGRLRCAQEHGRTARTRNAGRCRCGHPRAGFGRASGHRLRAGSRHPFELGIIRNHYVGRTFIQPTQSVRELGVRLKHSANRSVVKGKRIILIDDSIVRGTTSVKIVQMMLEAGAREVHFRISSPPITHPDYYGIDTPVGEKLLAATHSLEEMRKFIGCDSLALPFGRRHLQGDGFRGPRSRASPIHRPLLHRRLPDPADRRLRRIACAPAIVAPG